VLKIHAIDSSDDIGDLVIVSNSRGSTVDDLDWKILDIIYTRSGQCLNEFRGVHLKVCRIQYHVGQSRRSFIVHDKRHG
jgi:hypothetical protein